MNQVLMYHLSIQEIAERLHCSEDELQIEGERVGPFIRDKVGSIEIDAPPYIVFQRFQGEDWRRVLALGRWNPAELSKLSEWVDVPRNVLERVFRIREQRSVAQFDGYRVGSIPGDLGSWRECRRMLARLSIKRRLTDKDTDSILANPLCCQALEFVAHGFPLTDKFLQGASLGPLRTGRDCQERDQESKLEIENIYNLFDSPELLRPVLKEAAKIKGTRNQRSPNWADWAAQYMWIEGRTERQFVDLVGPLLNVGPFVGRTIWYRNHPSKWRHVD
jgi:hypothetical protein